MITPVTITGSLSYPDGSKANGSFTFVLTLDGEPSGMVNGTEMIAPLTIIGTWNDGELMISPVGGGPYEPLMLLAVDDPGTTPTGLVYTVTEQLGSGLGLPPWPLTVSHTSPTLDISSQRPVP
jgi:hypothetical protein